MQFDKQEYLTQLESLVNIDSGFGTVEGCSRILDFFTEKLQSIGFNTRRISGGGKYADCLIASNTDGNHYDLLFVGHVDTAFEDGAALLSPFRSDGYYAYGPGIADMKAGTLAIYHILKNAPKELLDALSICVIINGDEEIFAAFSEPILIEHASRSDYVFVEEAAFPDGSHCLQRKGRLRYHIEFEGISVHSGYIFETRNASAILEMAYWIQKLESLSSREKGTSFNAGIVNGGNAINMVPQKAALHFEFRMWDITEQKRIEDTITHMIRHPHYDGITARIVDSLSKPPMHPSRRTLEFIAKATEVFEAHGNYFMTRPRGGMSDANHFFQFTQVCLDGLGPRGELNTGDTDYESIILGSVPECVETNLTLMQLIKDIKEGKA